jgi:hypothetical protein
LVVATVNWAAVAPSLTEVTPMKFEPVIVTTVPFVPANGLKIEIVGGG